MRRFAVDKVRNLALIAHSGAGKTSLAEAMLYNAGVTDRLGRVDEGNTVMDYDPEEIRRKVSISMGIAPLEWKGLKFNVLDTPGYFDFVGEVKAALRVVETAILLVDAVAGVEVGAELTYEHAVKAGVSRLIVINKMDRENANFQKTLEALEGAFGRPVVPFQLPIGSEASFKGVVDVVARKAYVFSGKTVKEEAVPAELEGQIGEIRDKLMELAAEADDELTMKFLEEGELSQEEMERGLRLGVHKGDIVPVLVAAASKNIGISTLMDAIATYAPSPADRGDLVGKTPDGEPVSRPIGEDQPVSALVFKTTADPFVGRMTVMRVFNGKITSDQTVYNLTRGRTERIGNIFIPKGKGQEPVTEAGPGDIIAVAKLAVTQTNDTLGEEANPLLLDPVDFPTPVYSVAVHPKTKGDEEKIGSGLQRLAEEDATFTVRRDPVTSETIISGLGETHVDVMIERLKRKFGVEAVLTEPKVAYKETIKGKAQGEYKHKKQTGGRGQYGHCKIEIEPLYDGEYEFVDKIFAGAIPLNFRPAVDKGVQETMADGVLAGYPVTGVRCTLLDGSYHEVDSSEMAFKIAARNAFKQAFMNAKPVLLEPIMKLEVVVPEAYMGDIMGDLNKKRGRIAGMEPIGGGKQVIRAMVPLAELHRYAIDLRSMTQGRGQFTMEFDHYEEVPAQVAKAVIEASAANRKEEAE
ncbi:MAG: elongation factor G [Symbiobacterium sp.]|uniref:elongation factor G n=1 Tax=Symbiobacterium sp. TaxID=1971213 RepID=UPI0034645B33